MIFVCSLPFHRDIVAAKKSFALLMLALYDDQELQQTLANFLP